MQNEGAPYGVPHHTDTSAIFYNKELFESADITSVPTELSRAWTWDQFEDVLKTLKSKLPDGKYPFAYNWQGNGVTRWLSWLFEADGRFLAENLTDPAIDSEAARIDGAGHQRVFRSIVLPPLSKPLIAVLFFMTLLQSSNDFAWPPIALKQNELFTLPIGLLYLQGQFGSDFGGTMAFTLVNVIPMVILFLSFQRYFVQGFARSGIK